MTPNLLLPAEIEMLEAAAFYESHVPGLGKQFLDKVEAVLEAIATQPDTGTLIRPAIRRRLVHRFPYSVLYRVDLDETIVLAIAHQRRRPDYWIDRI